jgi:hypothetical protein
MKARTCRGRGKSEGWIIGQSVVSIQSVAISVWGHHKAWVNIGGVGDHATGGPMFKAKGQFFQDRMRTFLPVKIRTNFRTSW